MMQVLGDALKLPSSQSDISDWRVTCRVGDTKLDERRVICVGRSDDTRQPNKSLRSRSMRTPRGGSEAVNWLGNRRHSN